MTIQVSRMLQKAIDLRPELKAVITAQTIYANPTIDQLSTIVVAMLEGKSQAEIPREEKIHNLVAKYTSDLPVQKVRHNELQSPATVILTGSTGSLGNYLLHCLLSNESISKVYCLNRSDAESRQRKGFEEKGLPLDNWNKAEFLQVSFGAERFGLDEVKYQELLDSVDTIIHNAWKVDFNYTVDSFEDTHIQGVRRFVDFSLSSRHNAHFHFVSSVGTVGNWTPEMGPSIPEEPMESNVVLPQGYGESKHVAERICLEASRRSGVPTTVYRVGQIAGPTTRSGQWNPHEWLPTIIATSKAMGKIPNRLGSMPVDWVPVVRSI
jgi:thioester reductase-like protein